MKLVPGLFIGEMKHVKYVLLSVKIFTDKKIPGEKAILELRDEVLAVAQSNPDSHIFMDEVPFGPLALKSDFIILLGDCLKGKFLWIACKKNSSLDDPKQIQRNLHSFLIVGEDNLLKSWLFKDRYEFKIN